MGGKADQECKDCRHRKATECIGDDDQAEARIQQHGTCYEAPTVEPQKLQEVLIIPADPRYPLAKRPLVTSDMKAACIGDFHVEVEHTCPYCFNDEPQDDCEVCKGKVTYTVKHQIPWATMKAIYRAMTQAAAKETCANSQKRTHGVQNPHEKREK